MTKKTYLRGCPLHVTIITILAFVLVVLLFCVEQVIAVVAYMVCYGCELCGRGIRAINNRVLTMRREVIE